MAKFLIIDGPALSSTCGLLNRSAKLTCVFSYRLHRVPSSPDA